MKCNAVCSNFISTKCPKCHAKMKSTNTGRVNKCNRCGYTEAQEMDAFEKDFYTPRY